MQLDERMGQIKILMIGDHIDETFESNKFHTSGTAALHITENGFLNHSDKLKAPLHITFTNTPASQQIGPS